MHSNSNNVKVFGRFRPKTCKEEETDSTLIYSYPNSPLKNTIHIKHHIQQKTQETKNRNHKGNTFTFDSFFNEQSSQDEIYKSIAQPFVKEILDGFNCTIFAYGQSGSGKTFTMNGNDEKPGVIPRMISELYTIIEDKKKSNVVFFVQASYVQIYLEKIKDLLNPKLDNLKLREISEFLPTSSNSRAQNCVFIENCTICDVPNMKDMMKVMKQAESNKITASTELNEESSRSHAVFIITITQTDPVQQTRKVAKLFLVDLAGSEQVNKSRVTGINLEEAKNINKSLSTLSLVIQSLTDNKSTHIPYRDSKLTRLLTDSLGGNSKTALILTLSPSSESLSETISTLNFGSRAKRMKNNAKPNQDMTIDGYKKLVEKLNQELNKWKDLYEKQRSKETIIMAMPISKEMIELPPAFENLVSWPVQEIQNSFSEIGKAITKPQIDPRYLEFKELPHVTYGSEDVKLVEENNSNFDEMTLFRTGNLVVFGTDNIFTFETF